MKYIILFIILVFALPGFGQQGEVVKDSVRLYVDVNECGDSVWFAYTYVEYRGNKKASNSQPVGYSENDPCVGIGKYDTTGLYQAVANGAIEFDGKTRVGLLDYGRQQAQKAKDFVFQNQALKSYTELNRALLAAGMPGLFVSVEKQFADSLIGSYILVRPGVANANVTVTKTNLGAVRVRLTANSFLPIVLYADTWMNLRNVAGTGQHVDLFEMPGEKGRWVSLLGNYQLVKNARQVVQRGVK